MWVNLGSLMHPQAGLRCACLLTAAVFAVAPARARAEPPASPGGQLSIPCSSGVSIPRGHHPSARGTTETSCQVNESNLRYPDPKTGTTCASSDLTAVRFMTGEPTSFYVAESFSFLCDAEITGLTWWGFFIEIPEANEFINCTLDAAPADQDHWTIRYYRDDGSAFPDVGLPGELLAEFVDPPGITRIDTGEDPFDGLLSKMEMHFDLPTSLSIAAAEIIHLEIVSNYTLNDCFFCWQTAPPGDSISLQRAGQEQDYTLDGAADFDVAHCQDFSSEGGAVNPPLITPSFQHIPNPMTGCCTMRFAVQNRNCMGVEPIDTFYVAFARGNGAPACEDIADVSAPAGWTAEICEPWNEGRAIYKFTGAALGDLQTTFGMIRTTVNGITAHRLDPSNAISTKSILMWVSQDPLGETLCGSGTFGPLNDELGEWSGGRNAACPFAPIPAMTLGGKAVLVLLLTVAGTLLVLRCRRGPDRAAAINHPESV